MKLTCGRMRQAALVPALVFNLLANLAAPAQAQQMTAMVKGSSQATARESQQSKFRAADSGRLAVLGGNGKIVGKCPLKHTSVSANVSGYVASVTVKQVFENPFKDKIEAVYTFPLSESGAVDEMLMKVGSRTIRGSIKKREEARQIYDEAKASGHVASLLDQERSNIFTQSVANIMPGEKVEITLRYVDLLPYESGSFSFAFPTVVGPRFIPGQQTGRAGTGWANDTDAVPDASRLTPHVTPQGTRAGHDLSMEVKIDAGVPINGIESLAHDVQIKRTGSTAQVSLRDKATIPNKDFVLKWSVAGSALKTGYLTHRDKNSGYFTLMILPPKRVTPAQAAPKEMIFLIDCSGSQSGLPLDKAKETMNYILDHMNPQDTFQVISFSDHLMTLFDKPRAASEEMKSNAKSFIAHLEANGGTWMAPAVERACKIPADGNRLRIVTFMTDGYVGNDFEILGMVRKLRGNSRWFPFGTGSSVNRMLIDGIAREGGGEPEYVLLNSSGNEVGRKFYERISAPVLTDVKLDFGGMPVQEVFPHQISDVWAERPLYIKGRYTEPCSGTVTISGFASGKPYTEKLTVTLPEKESQNDVIASIWARAKVDRLMSEDYFGAQSGSVNKELKDEIIKVALDHHIMTQYTSFVAVEESRIVHNGKARTVVVPVEMPEGVSYDGVFGNESDAQAFGSGGAVAHARRRSVNYAPAPSASTSYGGMRSAVAKLSAAPGSVNQFAAAPPPPPMVSAAPQMLMGSAGSSMQEMEARDECSPARGKPQEKRDPVKTKLDKSLQDLPARLVKSNGLKVAGLEIANGKVTVQVWLTDASAKAVQKLKDAGLEIIFQATGAKMVIGRINIERLKKLALLDFVRLIEPPNALK